MKIKVLQWQIHQHSVQPHTTTQCQWRLTQTPDREESCPRNIYKNYSKRNGNCTIVPLNLMRNFSFIIKVSTLSHCFRNILNIYNFCLGFNKIQNLEQFKDLKCLYFEGNGKSTCPSHYFVKKQIPFEVVSSPNKLKIQI